MNGNDFLLWLWV